MERKIVSHFNWGLLFVLLALSAIGLANLYSASSSFEEVRRNTYFKNQLISTGVGFFSLVCILLVHSRHYASLSKLIYGMTIFLLVAVLVFGKKVDTHQSWFRWHGFSLQPTELAKLGLVFGLAKHLSNFKSGYALGFIELIPSFLIFIIPAGLVVLQNDMGSSLFFGLIYVSMMLVYGIRWQVLALVAVLGVALAVGSYHFILSPYQKARIINFANPDQNKKGSGYQIVQAKIAVGSGGLWGKGYTKGQTHKLKFVPARHTDFIFPVLAEEWGFAGACVVFGLFFLLLATGINVGLKSEDPFLFFLCVGICSIFFWHLVINLGGVLSLIPMTGVPLPFFSYGGSALITCWISVAIILNISMRRFVF